MNRPSIGHQASDYLLLTLSKCERCRKRKIKCSGNEGKSCANCINAGHEDTCRFLRVSSRSKLGEISRIDIRQVSSIEAEAFSFRGWQGPPRYSPYSLPTHHRLNYVSMPSRYSPPSSLQYPTVPTSVDYGGYAAPSPNVDWTRTPYVASFSPYPDDEESSAYSSQVQPPPYILPNTDPMSSTNAYCMHAQGVRPHYASLWPEPQHCIPQAGPQLNNPVYTAAPQPIQTMGVAGNPSSDRILPTPISARSIVPSSLHLMDSSTPVTSSGQQSSTYWTGESTTLTAHQTDAHMDTGGAQEPSSIDRTTTGYRIQDMPYAHVGLNETLVTTSLPHGLSLVVNDHAQPSATARNPEDSHLPNTGSRTASHETPSLKMSSETSTYNYPDSMTGGTSQQLRGSSGRISNGSAYCRTPSMVVPRREPTSDDCSPDCSSCQTDSTRTSIVTIGNSSTEY